MKRSQLARVILGAAIFGGIAVAVPALRADEPAKKPQANNQMQCCPMDPKASAALDRIKGLSGTWTSAAKDGKPAMSVNYRSTAGGSAVIETMFPGSEHEMINMFTADGDKIVMTHYCAMGVQPRMKLASSEGKTMKFEFIDGGNIKNRNEAHMDGLALTIDGDKITQNWSYYSDGKVVENTIFELQKQPAPQASK